MYIKYTLQASDLNLTIPRYVLYMYNVIYFDLKLKKKIISRVGARPVSVRAILNV